MFIAYKEGFRCYAFMGFFVLCLLTNVCENGIDIYIYTQFRENCFRRVREDRTRLLWKLRLSDFQSSDQKVCFFFLLFQSHQWMKETCLALLMRFSVFWFRRLSILLSRILFLMN